MRRGLLFLLCLFSCSLILASFDPFSYPVGTVIIDAGHGGHDPGAVATWSFADGTIYERDLTLDIAKRLYALLRVSHPELEVLMTRNDDTFVSLSDRCTMAYSLPLRPKTSALFVSIHVNSAASRAAKGFEILTKMQSKQVVFLDEKTPAENIASFSSHTTPSLNRLLNHRNLLVAATFEQTMSENLITAVNRGVKERDLWVLNGVRMPAVLVEVGFLSNEEDARNLVSVQYRQRLAQVLLLAIERCL
ncbi:MAG: N-acetylmuramoyl-L-alanine amidase [Spirochaetia bacterium]|nr:N-acetylmuramoyl-L-alanine amidase [Spirochaetia bacterium]